MAVDKWGGTAQKRAIAAHEKTKKANIVRAKAAAAPKKVNPIVSTGIRGSELSAGQKASNVKRWDSYRSAQAMKKATSGKMTKTQREGVTSAFMDGQPDIMSAAQQAAAADTSKRTSLYEQFGQARQKLARDKFQQDQRKAGYASGVDANGNPVNTRYGRPVDEYSYLADMPADATAEQLAQGVRDVADPEAAVKWYTPEQQARLKKLKAQVNSSGAPGQSGGIGGTGVFKTGPDTYSSQDPAGLTQAEGTLEPTAAQLAAGAQRGLVKPRSVEEIAASVVPNFTTGPGGVYQSETPEQRGAQIKRVRANLSRGSSGVYKPQKRDGSRFWGNM